MFYVFSSNADPFEPNQPCKIFTAYTLLEYNGDFAEAVTELLKQGYGKISDEDDVDLGALLKNQSFHGETYPHFITVRELLREYRNMKEPQARCRSVTCFGPAE